jgi:hypothetical protein
MVMKITFLFKLLLIRKLRYAKLKEGKFFIKLVLEYAA